MYTLKMGRSRCYFPQTAWLLLPLIKENIREINKRKLGITGVVDKNNNELIGVITDGDIRRYLFFQGLSKTTLAKDIMTRDPKTISKNLSLQEAILKMENYKITALFVVNKKKRVEGIIHMHHIIERGFL